MSYELLQLPTAKRQLRQLSKSHNPFFKQIISGIEALRAEPNRREQKSLQPGLNGVFALPIIAFFTSSTTRRKR